MKSAADLATTEVLNLDGDARPLGKAWAEGPIALVFIRHFG
jgi:hypothetical protein